MAVYTKVAQSELNRWLHDFDVGELTGMEPIADGIENTNYFVDTTSGRFVLTLIERIPRDDLPFFLRLMRHLARQGVPCPDPVPSATGELFGELNGKAATLVTRLSGRAITDPDPDQIRRVGALLARMHLAASGFGPAPANSRGQDWWPQAAAQLAPRLPEAERELMQRALAELTDFGNSATARGLPRSAVHADLFRDNVLFAGNGEPGPIDFFFACDDRWMFDLAVVCNDWCLRPGPDGRVAGSDGTLDPARVDTLLQGYRSVRAPSDDEMRAWPVMLRAAAFRFWMSRLYDQHFPRKSEILNAKDPKPFERILRDRMEMPG